MVEKSPPEDAATEVEAIVLKFVEGPAARRAYANRYLVHEHQGIGMDVPGGAVDLNQFPALVVNRVEPAQADPIYERSDRLPVGRDGLGVFERTDALGHGTAFSWHGRTTSASYRRSPWSARQLQGSTGEDAENRHCRVSKTALAPGPSGEYENVQSHRSKEPPGATHQDGPPHPEDEIGESDQREDDSRPQEYTSLLDGPPETGPGAIVQYGLTGCVGTGRRNVLEQNQVREDSWIQQGPGDPREVNGCVLNRRREQCLNPVRPDHTKIPDSEGVVGSTLGSHFTERPAVTRGDHGGGSGQGEDSIDLRGKGGGARN
jgi:hypothetical protein